MIRVVRWQAVLLAAVGLMAGFALPMGCGKPPPPSARVRGVVTFQARPLSGGLIVFVPDADRGCNGVMASAIIDRDGRFELANGAATVVPGWYRVAVSDSPDAFDTGLFPAKLQRPDRSGLEREVKPGHDHHFEFLIELTR